MPGAATGSAGGSGGCSSGGDIASAGGAGVSCPAVVDLPLAAVSVAPAAVATDGVRVEGGLEGACDVPEAEQGRGGALSSASVPGMGGVAAVDGSEIELSAAGLKKKNTPVSSRTAAVGARVTVPVAAAAAAAAAVVAAEGSMELKAAGTGPTATTQRPAATGSADLSIEPSADAAGAGAAKTEAAVAATAAPTPATADTPEAPGKDGGTTVASAVCARSRKTRRPSISLDGRPPAASPAPARSSGVATRMIANPVAPGSPPLRAVRPPRRDIRKDYLTNLGMKGAVMAGPGGTRIPPPMFRRSSFIEVSRRRGRRRRWVCKVVVLVPNRCTYLNRFSDNSTNATISTTPTAAINSTIINTSTNSV